MSRSTRPGGAGFAKALTIGALGGLVALGPAALAGSASAADTATGRNYEQVMPSDKAFPFGQANSQIAVAAVAGDAIGYMSFGPLAGSASGSQENLNVARRTPGGWVNKPISPRQNPIPGQPLSPTSQGFSADLSHVVFKSGNPPLTPDAPADVTSLYLGDTRTGAFTLLSTIPGTAGQSPFLTYGGASDDFTHVVFESNDVLIPGAGFPGVYEWTNGQLRNVGLYPDGSPVGVVNIGAGALATNRVTNAVSDDGRRIVFWDAPAGELYIRVDGATSVQATASQATTVDPNGSGGARFWAASSDARKVFFTSNRELTDDANTGDDGLGNPTDAGRDLYMFELNATSTGGALTDLSADTNPADTAAGADVQGVVGASDDGQYVYFVAHGILAPGATSGANNLYVRHGSQTKYIGALDNADESAWDTRESTPDAQAGVTARVTPDGRHLAIQSVARLTSYDNTDAGGTATRQVYRYAADSNTLTCVSCRPDGAAPAGNATITPPTWLVNTPRNISDDGRHVFFDSSDAILPADTNGRVDVYEWADGQIALVSDGRAGYNARFQDASASGEDVFFATSARLVPTDTDEHYELYDARIGGGFPAAPDTSVPPCEGDACQGAPTVPPAAPVAATVFFTGPGNDPLPVPTPSTSVKVTKPKSVTGASATVRVRVSGKGAVTISGSGLGTAKRTASKASTLNVKVSLTKAAKATLKRRHTLKVTAKVTFKPSGGTSASAKVALTFKQPKAKKTSKKGRS